MVDTTFLIRVFFVFAAIVFFCFHSFGLIVVLHQHSSGDKSYQLVNHTENVVAVVSSKVIPKDTNQDGISDKKVSKVLSMQDYTAFGVRQKERAWKAEPYRYGFNGKEIEFQNDMNQLEVIDYGYRSYNPSLGFFISIDPMVSKYASFSPYNFVFNNPIGFMDPDGNEPLWKPRVVKGRVQLIKEEGDNFETLKTYFSGSGRYTDKQLKTAYDDAIYGVFVVLPEDNYSHAYSYAMENEEDFPPMEKVYRFSRGEIKSFQNYNCYHFALNGVWEKEIYSFWSYGSYLYDTEKMVDVLKDHFVEVKPEKAIYGETLIMMNYSGKYPMHAVVFAGRDAKGKTYVMQKYGDITAPDLIPLDDLQWKSDAKYFNEK